MRASKVLSVTLPTFSPKPLRMPRRPSSISLNLCCSSLRATSEAMLAARATLLEQFNKLHKAVLQIARKDESCCGAQAGGDPASHVDRRGSTFRWTKTEAAYA